MATEERPGPSNRYRIRHFGLGSLSKFGCLVGALVSFMPSLFLGCGGVLAVRGLRSLLEGWERAQIHVLGQVMPVDVIALLHLESLLRTSRVLDNLSWALLLATVALGSVLGGLFFLVLGDLAGWIYNVVARLSGGLEVELTDPRGSRVKSESGEPASGGPTG
jgi:hypothetical protein